MTKRTHASVTEIPCQCGHIEQLARDPSSPIKFRAEVNEYHVQYKATNDADVSSVIYHCIFCGGAMPPSKRGQLFESISGAEKKRIEKLVSQLKTVDDALREFGPADFDDPVPDAIKSALESSGTTPVPIRTLIYSRLSKVADVHITVTSSDSFQVMVAPKRR